MLDGFQFDTEYGAGPYEKARLPEAKGLSALPSGMIPMDSTGESSLPDGVEVDLPFDLEEMTRDASQSIALVDHSWLATQSKPDLSGQRSLEDIYEHLAAGRFENPEVNQFKNLQDAWGTESTTGLDIIPNKQRHHEKYKNTYEGVSKVPGDDERQELEKIHRKLAYGEPLAVILKEASDPLSIKGVIESDYGLSGRVYIKEAHFPGLFNGRWNEVINNRCKTAMYIVPAHKDCAFDRFLGMEVVRSVKDIPWRKVATALLPRLETYGIRVASEVSDKERVRLAFIDLIEGRVARHEPSQSWFPTQRDDTALISLDHARRQLEASQVEHTFIASSDEVYEGKTEKRLQRIAKQLTTQGLLDSEVIDAVLSSGKTAQQKIDRLYEIASTPTEASTYEGMGKGATIHTPHKSKIATEFKTRSEITYEQRVELSRAKISKLLEGGLVTQQEVKQTLSKLSNQPEAQVKELFRIASEKVERSSYEGTGVGKTLHTPHKSKIATEFKTRSEITFEERVKTAETKLMGLVGTGLVTAKQVEGIALSSKTNPEEAVKRAYLLAAQNFMQESHGSYSGEGVGVKYISSRVASKISNEKIKHHTEVSLEKRNAKRNARAVEKIGLLVSAGLITHEEVAVAIKGVKEPELRVASVCAYIAKAKPKVVGTYNDYDLKEHRMVKQSKKLDKLPDMEKRASANLWREAHAKVDQLLKSGLLSKHDFDSIQSIGDANAYVKKAFDLASKPSSVSTYEGTETAHIITKKTSDKLSDTELKVATWLRQKMSEGSAGQELDVLLRSRFSEKVLDTYGTRIASLRSQHEGLAGHAYVDAGAYATEGVEGCEKGALLHRANQVPVVLSVDKCASCVFNVEGTCQKYNKALITSPVEIIEDLSDYQRENIRLANGTDADRTASLFVNDYDPDEFGLLTPDQVEISDEVSNKALGDVLFGGFEV
jgi:hypothetical protein